MDSIKLNFISTKISESLGRDIVLNEAIAAFGGDINTCYIATGNEQKYFIKTNTAPIAGAMFSSEADGLRALAEQQLMKVPTPLLEGEHHGTHFLVMEALNIQNSGDWAEFALALLQVHEITNRCYGFSTDNFIGRSPQYNNESNSWASFWWEQRLLPQMEMAYANSYKQSLKPLQTELERASAQLLDGHEPNPALVHGDLWGGNLGFHNDQPCIYDPAAYFGDPEVDIALTQLFGSLPSRFYTTYQEHAQLPSGYEQRFKLYNLYHLLNHLNLFGGHYLQSSVQSIKDLARL